MNKRLAFLAAFDINPLVLWSLFFTFNVVLTAIFSHISGYTIYYMPRYVLNTGLLCAAPVVALLPTRIQNVDTWVENNRFGFLISLVCHFILSCAIVAGISVIMQASLLSVLRGFVQSYIIIILCVAAIEYAKTAAANKNLKKIQDSKKGGKN